MRVYPTVALVPIVDVLLVAVAMAFGAISLAYPLGRDQGLFYYVGREWLHGSVPYRDTLEQKPPLIYLIYALATIVFGENLWSIRLLELIWVVVIGQILGSLAAPIDKRPVVGTRGIATLASAVLYWGYMGYWDTAQCEIWCGGLLFFSLWAGRHIARRPLAWGLAGVFAGLALLAKPTVIVTLAVVVTFFVFQLWYEKAKSPARWREISQFIACYLLAAVLPIAITIGYFWAVGGLSDCVDILIGANSHYISHEYAPGTWWQHLVVLWLQRWPFSSWISILFIFGVVFAWKTRSLEVFIRYALAALLIDSAIASVVMQNKFYGYHWGILVFPGAYMIACFFDDCARWLSVRRTRYRTSNISALAFACIILGSFFAFAWTSIPFLRAVVNTLKLLNGTIEEGVYDRQFDNHGIPTYWWGENRQVGHWIAEHSNADDLVAVRGFEPAIYAISGRRAPTRFFWTAWLTDPFRTYKRDQWLYEDSKALALRPPRYLVVMRVANTGPNSAEFAASFGYVHERFGTAHFRVMERF